MAYSPLNPKTVSACLQSGGIRRQGMPPLGGEERNKVTHNPYTPTGGALHLERSHKRIWWDQTDGERTWVGCCETLNLPLTEVITWY